MDMFMWLTVKTTGSKSSTEMANTKPNGSICIDHVGYIWMMILTNIVT